MDIASGYLKKPDLMRVSIWISPAISGVNRICYRCASLDFIDVVEEIKLVAGASVCTLLMFSVVAVLLRVSQWKWMCLCLNFANVV